MFQPTEFENSTRLLLSPVHNTRFLLWYSTRRQILELCLCLFPCFSTNIVFVGYPFWIHQSSRLPLAVPLLTCVFVAIRSLETRLVGGERWCRVSPMCLWRYAHCQVKLAQIICLFCPLCFTLNQNLFVKHHQCHTKSTVMKQYWLTNKLMFFNLHGECQYTCTCTAKQYKKTQLLLAHLLKKLIWNQTCKT